MKCFEHRFDGKTFKLSIQVNELDCFLHFEIFDNNKVYLNKRRLPVYKQRLLELIENLKIPTQTNMETYNFMPPFNFGHQKKSYLLFNIQLILDRGILMGCIYEKEDRTPAHFEISNISGKELIAFLENVLIDKNK